MNTRPYGRQNQQYRSYKHNHLKDIGRGHRHYPLMKEVMIETVAISGRCLIIEIEEDSLHLEANLDATTIQVGNIKGQIITQIEVSTGNQGSEVNDVNLYPPAREYPYLYEREREEEDDEGGMATMFHSGETYSAKQTDSKDDESCRLLNH